VERSNKKKESEDVDLGSLEYETLVYEIILQQLGIEP